MIRNCAPYHYVYVCYTDNMCWGRMKLGESENKAIANRIGYYANKGCYIVVKERRYDI